MHLKALFVFYFPTEYYFLLLTRSRVADFRARLSGAQRNAGTPVTRNLLPVYLRLLVATVAMLVARASLFAAELWGIGFSYHDGTRTLLDRSP